MPAKYCCTCRSGFRVPERWGGKLLWRCLQHRPRGCQNALRINPNNLIGAVVHRGGPLRALAQRQARYAKNGGLLLYSTGISEDETGLVVQRKEVKISERVERNNSNTARSVCIRQIAA